MLEEKISNILGCYGGYPHSIHDLDAARSASRRPSLRREVWGLCEAMVCDLESEQSLALGLQSHLITRLDERNILQRARGARRLNAP